MLRIEDLEAMSDRLLRKQRPLFYNPFSHTAAAIADIDDRIRKLEKAPKIERETVKCETCRCLLEKVDAQKGATEVRRRMKPLPPEAALLQAQSGLLYPVAGEEEYLYVPYYCVRCFSEVE
jgi:hypothetical protein